MRSRRSNQSIARAPLAPLVLLCRWLSFLPRLSIPSLLLRSLVALLLLNSVGCTPSTRYDWGSYDSAVAHFYSREHAPQLDAVIDELAAELRATSPDKIPPGKAATVGFLYQERGDVVEARKYYQLEKQLFPESASFIDNFFLQRKKR